MGLAGAGRAEHDHVLRVLDEVEGFEGLTPVVDGEAQGCPVVAVELLGLGEPGLFEQSRAFGAFPGFDLGVHPRVHELHLRGRGRLQLFGQYLSGQGEPAGEPHDPVHHRAGRRATPSRVGLRGLGFGHHASFLSSAGRMNRS